MEAEAGDAAGFVPAVANWSIVSPSLEAICRPVSSRVCFGSVPPLSMESGPTASLGFVVDSSCGLEEHCSRESGPCLVVSMFCL